MPYTKSSAIKISELNPHLFGRWYDRKWIIPSIQPGGKGRPNLWTLEDIVRVRVIRELTESGYPLGEAHLFVSESIFETMVEHAIEVAKKNIADGGQTPIDPFGVVIWRPIDKSAGPRGITIIHDGTEFDSAVKDAASRECARMSLVNFAAIAKGILLRAEKEPEV